MTSWDDYKSYWDAHWGVTGPDTFVTRMTQDQYNEYYAEVFGNMEQREVKVLFDLGCGTGLMVPIVRKMWPEARYIGMDICDDAIQFARRQYPELDWLNMHGPRLPGKADMILVISVFTHITQADTEQYLDIIREALNPGGRAVVSVHIDTESLIIGGIPRVDYNPAYFENIISTHGFRILSVTDGIQRYYEVEPC